jgi:hypothetical protein
MLRFWSAALGYDIDGDHLRPPPDAEPGSPTVWLQGTDAVKRDKLRGHVDLYVVADGDVVHRGRLADRPGRPRADVGRNGEEGFVVLADPEGNELCILHRRWRR